MASPFRKNYNIRRKSEGSYIDGVWTPLFSSTIQTLMSVQPMTGREIESLNIGQRERGKVKIYSDSELNVAKQGQDFTGDIIEFQGYDYEVIAILPYQSDIINHYKYIAEFRGVTS